MMNLELRIIKHHRAREFSILNAQFSILPCVIVLWLLCCNAAADNLRFKFQAGDKYYLSSVTEEKITRTTDGNEQVMNRTTRLDCDFDVDEVDENGLAWVKYTYRRTGQKIKGPDIDVNFDSAGETKKIYSQALPMLLVIGEGLYIRISPQGRVDKINGLQAVSSNVKSNISRMTDRDKLTTTNAIDEMLSESTIKRTLEEQLAVFPDANHNPEWTRTVEDPAKKTVQKWSYRLKNSQSAGRLSADGITIVDVNLDITPSADTEEVVRGGVKYRHQTSGSGQGQIEIDFNATGTRPIVKNVIMQHLTEELKGSSQGPVLRVPQIAEPVQTHIVSTFQMTRREPPAKTGEPNQPADTNH